MKRLPAIHFVLSQNRNSCGERCIYLRVFIERRYLKRSTGNWVRPDDWDAAAERVRRTHPDHEMVNSYLGTLVESLKGALLNGGEVTHEAVRRLMGEPQRPGQHTEGVASYAEAMNGRDYDSGRITHSTFVQNGYRIGVFRRFLKERLGVGDIPLDEVRKWHFDEFVSYRINTRGNTSAIVPSMLPLYRAVREAAVNGLMDKGTAEAVCSVHKGLKAKRPYAPGGDRATGVKHLTPDELRRLHGYWMTTSSKVHRRYLDLFFFSFFACGLRVSDLVTLRWSEVDLERRVINKVQYKTRRRGRLSPVFSDEGAEILRRWRGKGRGDGYVFGVLPDGFDMQDEAKLNKRKSTYTVCADRSLKGLGKKLGIGIPLTMHVARHTFAVMAASSGTGIYLISKLMGHRSVTVTETVYADILQDSTPCIDIYRSFRRTDAPAEQ